MENKNRVRSFIMCLLAGFVTVKLFSLFLGNNSVDVNDMPYVTYEEMQKQIDAGNVDSVHYSSEDLMYFCLATEESRELSYNDKRNYDYPAENMFATQYYGGEDFKKDLAVKGISVYLDKTLDTFDVLMQILLMSPSIVILIAILVSIKKVGQRFGDDTMSKENLMQTSDKRFSDVIGHDEVIEDIRFLVEILKDPNKGVDIGAKPPKGILFQGPPGTGKTLLAKAIAGEAGVPFLYASGSQFKELYVGVGAKRVRELFDEAKKNKPCIIFIDEIDSCGGERSAAGLGGSDESNQTINEILTQMGGFKERDGIFVIAATNRPDQLDPALIRPGRFDRQVIINPPANWQVREDLLKFYLNSIHCGEDVNTERIAKQLIGFTGADIETVCNEAAIVAMMRDSKVVMQQDLEEAIDKKLFKGNRSKRDTLAEDKKIVARHEAGHALMRWLCKMPISRASIQGTTSGVGGVVFGADTDTMFRTKQYFRDEVKVCYAGYISELLLSGEVTTGASNDIEQASQMCSEYVCSYGFNDNIGLLSMEVLQKRQYIDKSVIFEQIQKLSSELYKEAHDILEENKKLLDSLAVALFEKETLSGEEIDDILQKGCETVLQP